MNEQAARIFATLPPATPLNTECTSVQLATYFWSYEIPLSLLGTLLGRRAKAKGCENQPLHLRGGLLPGQVRGDIAAVRESSQCTGKGGHARGACTKARDEAQGCIERGGNGTAGGAIGEIGPVGCGVGVEESAAAGGAFAELVDTRGAVRQV